MLVIEQFWKDLMKKDENQTVQPMFSWNNILIKKKILLPTDRP